MSSGVPVVVVGAGQAGLATSCELTRLGIEHVVLERGRIGQSWRDRWDSFCLVTPNWSVQLPDGHYDGPEPDGFMPRDELAAWFERYAARVAAPVREGVAVTAVEPQADGGHVVRTTEGDLSARAVVLATGAYQRPHRPAGAGTLPEGLLQLDVEGYRNERELPAGRILVVGSGQSGCQVAEELHEAGRDVVVACGRAPWLPRRFGGHDLVWWLHESGFLDAPTESLPGPEARLFGNVLATGRGGGHDLHLRTLHARGVVLTGHFLGATGRHAEFAPDLEATVAWGDGRHRDLMALSRKLAAERDLELDVDEPPPLAADSPERVDLAGLGAVIFAGGFRPDYRSWLPWPGAWDEYGFPVHRDGESTAVPGVWFVGVHFLRRRKSSLLIGVGEDAALVARGIAQRAG